MSKTLVQPYLMFGGRCAEALEFYRTALGAQVDMLMRFKDSPVPHPPGMVSPEWEEKVMHASVKIGESTIMASDGCEGSGAFAGFSLSIAAPDVAEATRAFHALAEGGEIKMPLAETFWSPCFGMVTDRFGLGWMVNVEAAPAQS